ncbi:hypothetical protein PRIPAC_74340, partial [Pristionchus pacificus]
RSIRGMRRACRAAMQLRLSSTTSAVVAGPSRSIGNHRHSQRSTVAIAMSSQDEKLIQRGEFHGVAATTGGKRVPSMQSPELALSRLHDNLHRNYRVNPESVMIDLVLKLENGDEALISLLKRSPERWIPMSIRCCGRALSSIQLEGRRAIAKRLWTQIVDRGLPISIESMNAYLKVLLENENKWNPVDKLKKIEEDHGLVPDQETFRLLLQKLSLKGEIKECSKMCYEMARHGQSPSDDVSHSHLVYANAVRGYDHKADSMIEQASTKFGSEGEALSLGAACVAAASGGNIDRLRAVLRRSVDENLRLRLPIESVFEIIWALSQKSGDNDKNYQSVMEEILSRAQHPQGFFRFLYREIERHISSYHFRSSMVLLGETMRVKNSLQRQDRNVFAEQLIGRMCRAMIRSKMEEGSMMEMANRIVTTMHIRSRFIHDELMLSALMLKDCDPYERFDSFSSILPVVDPKRERPHLILPILALTNSVDDRLKFLFRASALGYSNFDELDTGLMAQYLFQPMYRHQSWLANETCRRTPIMDIMTDIIHSYGVSKPCVWRMMNNWWKIKKEEERNIVIEMRMKPHADEIHRWLRSEYSGIFEKRNKEDAPTFVLSKAKLENAIEKGDASTILSLLSSHGWPEDVVLASFAPRILELLLANENNANIMKWLTALSREASCRQELHGQEIATPLDSSHIVKVIRHSAKETPMSTKSLIEMAYELKRLFPRAVFGQDSFLETIPETNKLIAACFIFKNGNQLTMEAVDDIIELMRTLLKLEIIGLSPNAEIVTPFCVLKVLQRFGWNSAVTLWLRFQSSFSFGNGMIILLSHSLSNDNVIQGKESIQYVLHKAHTCMSPSRIHALHAATLVNTRKMEDEAVEYFHKYGSEISPYDCALAYRLINSVKYPPSDKFFIRTFPSLCLKYTSLAEMKDGEARNMLTSALKFCEVMRLGPLIVEMCDMFARYGVQPDNKERRRIENTMEEHQKLVNRWIFSPYGFIQANPEQEFIKEDEWKKYVRRKEITSEPILSL